MASCSQMPTEPQAPPLICKTGPARKNFGGSPWLVYSCNEPSTIKVIAAPGSKAAPFSYTLYENNGKRRLEGEGSGDEKLDQAAYGDLKLLRENDVRALIQETRHTKPAAKPKPKKKK